ncbi:hypothetical protein Dda_5705 [Drechslerella dactyloides]|uniref:Uncharacterized protein n=1 Tax=Drechslerella dactyloides TaxID=74499 RepID=A0AAD6IXZ8_DREDA|nr:hypothetical protein Dda_5705 [Drechslerella dactyloides]
MPPDPNFPTSEFDPMMQLRPFSNPFARRMLDKKPVAPQLVFIEEDAALVSDQEDFSETSPNTRPIDIPSLGALEKYRSKPLSELSNEDSGAMSDTRKSSPKSSPKGSPKKAIENQAVAPSSEQTLADGVKRVKLDIPAKDMSKTLDDGSLVASKRMPPTTIFSHSTTSVTSPPPDLASRRLFSLPSILDEDQRPSSSSSRATSISRAPGPAPPPKPLFRPLQRRATTPAEAQPSRQTATAAKSKHCITLPSIDIMQTTYSQGQMYRESELLLDIFNAFKNNWPDRPYAVMNHLRNSLLLSVAVFDDPAPIFATDHGGSVSVKEVVCRYRRHRPANLKRSASRKQEQQPIDLCLVLWRPAFMSFREQCVLQETQRYRARHSAQSPEWPGAQRVAWYPSWEPSGNLPEGMADVFSSEKERVDAEGGELTFDLAVADGDWC